ncbi:ImmA/IrrE family metallo-endopeptidase [Rhodococcus sp. DSM 6344]|nr:ImmA/IrrE family metallo-endopeptidase [Rhodococcus erythropolis]
MRELEDLAGANGIAILEGNLPAGERGRWYPGPRIIILQADMPTDWTIAALSHELGHATHNHDMSTTDARIHSRQEREADEYAARLLIDPIAFEETERLYSSDTATLAHHLCVTPQLVRVWREMILREKEGSRRWRLSSLTRQRRG